MVTLVSRTQRITAVCMFCVMVTLVSRTQRITAVCMFCVMVTLYTCIEDTTYHGCLYVLCHSYTCIDDTTYHGCLYVLCHGYTLHLYRGHNVSRLFVCFVSWLHFTLVSRTQCITAVCMFCVMVTLYTCIEDTTYHGCLYVLCHGYTLHLYR